MASLVRIANAFYAALFLVAALLSLGMLAAAFDGLGRGPEAIWRSAGGALAGALLAILCIANMRFARARAGRGRIAANGAALLLAAAALLSGETALRWIGGVGALPFLVTLAAAAHRQDSA